MLLKKLWRTAWKYRTQFISMVLMVGIGVGLFMGLNMEWASIEGNIGEFFTATNFADFRLVSPTGFSKDDLEKIRKIPEVKRANRFLSVNGTLKESKLGLAITVAEDYQVSTMQITAGEPYDGNKRGFWLSQRVAKANNLKVGDQITLVYNNIEITAPILGLGQAGEYLVAVADANQLMPDHKLFGFIYATPTLIEEAVGQIIYPQIHIIATAEKKDFAEKVNAALGKTTLLLAKNESRSYLVADQEASEGKTLGTFLPIIFLAIAFLTMVTTMHRITANEKVQIGTMKALGFKNSSIILHYSSFGLLVGLFGLIIATLVGLGIGYLFIDPEGMMGSYFDTPPWRIFVPSFCWGAIILVLALLFIVCFLSVHKTLSGNAAAVLRPYVPQKMRRMLWEKSRLWNQLSFGIRWNIRDILRHKNRSLMSLLGVIGCMILLIASLGMRDTMDAFLNEMNETAIYTTRVNLVENLTEDQVTDLQAQLIADSIGQVPINYQDETIVASVVDLKNNQYNLKTPTGEDLPLADEGAYLCMRLQDTAKIGDLITIKPLGSHKIITLKVAGYHHSALEKNIVMTNKYAKSVGLNYTISNLYTSRLVTDIPSSELIASTQSKTDILDTYHSFTEIMDLMVLLLMSGAVILGTIVLYNLGVMSYVERYRELATLKVVGFKNGQIGNLLISQNVWITIIGIILGCPLGFYTLDALIKQLSSNYEYQVYIGPFTYIISLLVTLGVSVVVGWFIARKNRHIDMVEALKGVE